MKSKDDACTACDRLRAEVMKAKSLGSMAGDRQWSLSAGDLFELMDAVDSARLSEARTAELEGDLYTVYEVGRQTGLDVARWLAGELSRNRILVSHAGCCQCARYSFDECRKCWMQEAARAVREGRHSK